MSKRLSSHATSLADRLVLHIHNATGHTRTKADLETWWAQRPRVHRVELFRLLSDLVDEGRLARRDGGWTTSIAVPEPAPSKVRAALKTFAAKVDHRPVPAAGTVPARILATLRRGRRTTADIIERLGLLAPTARGRLSELARDGWIAKDDDGKWSVVA